MNREITSRNIQGIADLVICAPLKQGFIDAFENVTYETRLEIAAKTLHKLRVAACEYELIKPFTNVVDRIQSLLSFRIGIIDTPPARSLILSATFDRPWEPYIRLIWNPLGSFLDLLLCNCEGYVSAIDNSFPRFAQWVRDHQVDSSIFYSSSPLTVGDQFYLEQFERLQREGKSDLELATFTANDLERPAAIVRERATLMTPTHDEEIQAQFLTMACEALAVLYRLADYYPPDRPDKEGRMDGEGKYLLRATKDLLKGWNTRDPNQLPPGVRKVHAEMFDWFERKVAGPPEPGEAAKLDRGEVQAGILSGYDAGGPVKHGCLLLFGIVDPAGARQFIGSKIDMISWEGGEKSNDFMNLALTCCGLSRLGRSPESIRADFPKEFREGMIERAPLLGDVRENHPDRWPLPERFLYKDAGGAPFGRPRVELSEVDIVIQLRTTRGEHDFIPLPNCETALRQNGEHPLAENILELIKTEGLRLLSIQPMRRIPAKEAGQFQEHFGFVDGISQPVHDEAHPRQRDAVSLGELLLGYRNDWNDPPVPKGSILYNGSFMVIRKMRQDVNALIEILEPYGEDEHDLLLAKMVGRFRDGRALAKGRPAGNNFGFESDLTGEMCPFQAHIRRTNNRTRPVRRIMRRGMSYGPTFRENKDETNRGTMFLAYNASIAEQYEAIQRWINGGNNSGVASAQNDPLIGVMPEGGTKTFRFVAYGQVVPVKIEKPLVCVEWGLYLFVPSRTALLSIANQEMHSAIGDAAKGEEIIETLRRMHDSRLSWKTYLEDLNTKDPKERGDSPHLWAAIRDRHNGVLRTPAGVIVASDEYIRTVMTDEKNYTVEGEAERMEQSFGRIYVGIDDGDEYRSLSKETNNLLMNVTVDAAFASSFKIAKGVLDGALEAGRGSRAEIDLRRDFITPTLAQFCQEWFGLPDQAFVVAGGWNWDPVGDPTPRCPGDFMAPSRYCFYPDPIPAIAKYGRDQGKRLTAAAERYFAQLRKMKQPQGGLAAEMLKFKALRNDNNLLARTLIGIMVGMLPPTDGNLRAILYEWLEEKTFWRHQQSLAAASGYKEPNLVAAIESLEGPLKRAMQKRPAPDLLWRTAKKADTLGTVNVEPGDKIILAIVSATLEKYNDENNDVYAVFGGNRRGVEPPTHACPAYNMAMGAMLGILAALLSSGQIEALRAPLLVRLVR